MKAVLAIGAAVLAAAVGSAWLLFGLGHAADAGRAGQPGAGVVETTRGLVVHEWGTFTSFSGSDGVPVTFEPNYTDLPSCVYSQEGDANSKGGRLYAGGTVSMETPVLYFYADKTMKVSVRVDFPLGWITEWYPFAAGPPVLNKRQPKTPGQGVRWDVKLLPEEVVALPREEKNNSYYQARETDAIPLQAEVLVPKNEREALRGGMVVQQEKFLFYRGVGTFPPPMKVRALGKSKVLVKNTLENRVGEIVLVTVRGQQIGFKMLADLNPQEETEATLAAADTDPAELAKVLVKALTAAGLYDKEARAMVKTWEAAWFGEEGTRLLYLVPRARTDELLHLNIEPKPTEVVRVLVGRHDFVTPEQESGAERQIQRVQAARSELESAEEELGKLGRFAYKVRLLAEKRLESRAAQK